ncbi:MAG: cobaltochelatase CobN, partial [bacterium]
MHRIATESGDLAHEKESNLIEQTPADILFLSAADTDLACVAQTWGTTFGDRLRVAHAGALQQPNAVEHYADNVIVKAKLVIFRLLGGKAYFSDLLDELEHLRAHHLQARILLLPGTDTWDTELLEYGDYAEPIVKQIFSYFKEGGIDNIERAGQAIQLLLDNQTTGFPEAIPMPKYGWYQKKSAQPKQENQPIAWVCFYRALQQVGDLAVVDALWESLEEQGFFVEAFYAYSLREPEAQEALLQYANESQPNVVLTLQSFSICINAPDRVSFLEILGCPILQVPVSSHDRHTWEHDMRGITPSDVAMNVALPEIDGRIFSSIIGFKEEYQPIPEIEFTVKSLRPDLEQVSYVAKQAKNWAKLQEKENSEKKIAIILANYPTKTSRIGNGVGLDTPASVVKFLRVLEEEGYNLGELPEDSKELMEILQEGVTNDAEANYGKTLDQWLEKEDFQNYFNSLPEKSRNKIAEQWTHELPEYLGIAGKQFGNVFVGIQPQRGFGIQDMAIYHDPKLSPPPEYLAFYYWIREHFHADAIIHFGKHGNLEWLPGKSVALGKED